MSKHEIRVFDQQKVFFHADRIKSFFDNPSERCLPVTLSTDLSYVCNHRCPWCLSGDVIDRGKEVMNKDIMDQILGDLEEGISSLKYHTKAVCCSGGGDPTTNPNLDYYLSSLQELGIEVSMNTNGQILHKRLKESTLRKMKYIRFSVDAFDEESHQFAHNREGEKNVKFDDVMENIKWAARLTKDNDKNAIIGIGYLVHENCIPKPDIYVGAKDSWKRFFDWLHELNYFGVDYIQFRPLKDKEQLESNWVRDFMRDINYFSGGGTLLKGDHKISLKDFKNLSIRVTFEKMEDTILGIRYPYCYQAPLIGNVGPTGIVYNCPDLRHNTEGIIGCLEEEDLIDIWGGEKHRRWLNERNFRKCPQCKYQYQNNLLEGSVVNGDSTHMNFI